MSYTNKTYTRENVIAATPGVFNILLDETCKLIHSLQLFRSVGIKVRATETILTPTCIVYPVSRREVLTLNNAMVHVEYKTGLAYAFKEPSDNLVTQMALDYTETICKRLGRSLSDEDALDYTKNLLLFPEVAGHFNTEIQQSEFGDIMELGQNILAYNSGLILVYMVEEQK